MLTIGHSNHRLAEFVEMLKGHGVERLVDVRTIPSSRYNPQFNRESLPEPLHSEGIGYVHMPGLGGLRHPRKDSRNTGWRNLSFRGYADYMQTPEFEEHLAELVRMEGERRVAIMCAESVPWRCHRSMIADALTARGVSVRHIMSVSKATVHSLTAFAQVDGSRVTYPSSNMDLFAD